MERVHPPRCVRPRVPVAGTHFVSAAMLPSAEHSDSSGSSIAVELRARGICRAHEPRASDFPMLFFFPVPMNQAPLCASRSMVWFCSLRTALRNGRKAVLQCSPNLWGRRLSSLVHDLFPFNIPVSKDAPEAPFFVILSRMTRPIVQDGAAVLRAQAEDVPERYFGTEELSRLVADMADALDKEPDGVALAAPQIGVSWRLFIVRKDRTLPAPPSDASPLTPEVEVYVNPEIVKTSRKRQRADEGCLSVRGVYGTTRRHERVTIRARREDGSRFTKGAGGLLAQIFEHETDHLNGILFTDDAENLVEIHPDAPAVSHD